MEFAVVRFVEEGGAPGVVSTNWIDYTNNVCLYPNVKMEYSKNKLLLARAKPGDGWTKCKIKVLKEYTSYNLAKSHLSEAEDTSNLDTEGEGGSFHDKKRKTRRPFSYTDTREKDISSDEEQVTPKKYKLSLEYPLPPKENPQLPVPSPSSRATTSSNITITSFSSEGHEERGLIYDDLCYSPSEKTDTISNRSTPPLSRNSTPMNSSKGVIQLSKDMRRLEVNQGMMWETLQRIEKKCDLILARDSSNSNNIGSNCSSSEFEFLASLPVAEDKINQLEDLLCEKSTFRKELVRILLTVGGRDLRSVAANVLRKIISDEAAELFTLTGKSRQGPEKKAFEKTRMYKLATDMCYRKCPGVDNSEAKVREAVSDWLMQAKFRRSRRESRKLVGANKENN